MDPNDLNRRDFHKLTMAALGGVVAGATAGCSSDKPANPTPTTPEPKRGSTEAAPASKSSEAHACRGLNACKGEGAGGDNDCAGKGSCASTSAHHSCSGQNECKGQGGCGETPGQNDCKGHGGCHVPMSGDMWKSARKSYEAKMKTAGKTFGDAPAAAK